MEIVECVNLAVKDWSHMKEEIQKAIAIVDDNSHMESMELKNEIISFLHWLSERNFVFLGSFECIVKDGNAIPLTETKKGIGLSKVYPIDTVPMDVEYEQDTHLPIFIRKWDKRSVVHRTSYMDSLNIKKFDSEGNCIGMTVFLGLFTSSVYYQSVRNIPFIRRKIDHVLERYGYPEFSHNAKELLTAIEGFPRAELLQMTEDELYDTATGIVSLTLMPRVRIFILRDKVEKFLSCITFIPKARFSTKIRETIGEILSKTLNGTIAKHTIQIGDSQLARVHFMVKTTPGDIPKYDTKEIERTITNAVSIWTDDLLDALSDKYPKREVRAKYQKFKDAFDVKYKATFTPAQAVLDIKMLEETIHEEIVNFDIYSPSSKDIHIKIYSPKEKVPLSSIIPIIENMGFFALDVLTFKTNVQDLGKSKVIWIYNFMLKLKSDSDIEITDKIKSNLKMALDKIWEGSIEDDKFNSLILYATASWRETAFMRAYAKYLKQAEFPHSPEFIVETLVKHPKITKKIIGLFECKFNPNSQTNSENIENRVKEIKEDLTEVSSIVEDKVINSYLKLINATKRTNFFVINDKKQHREYISFKISSKELPDLPEPKPFMEIFVYSPRFEAIHLRGGKIARGGLRWSDRKEDFRTEVLGLMKAQMTKNSVIVPEGSKGGFVLKKFSLSVDRETFILEGIDCYKMFLSGILDITDNIVEGKILPPQHVIRYDEDDPYLVVAADKGTATFSDYANEVSNKYGFWLADAFASGGSVGYDHKKMGITAKGAWVSVERHFREMGIDISKTPFTVVGIGDMSGDVFGNGMLLSKKIKLVAAFNHLHIFIDPDPDTEKSYKERESLFRKSPSQWTDYNQKLISKGGGIFERSAKRIQITQEMKDLFEITENALQPDELISRILKANVDLLWNGGIGTYVKASHETNEMIGDKANDSLRINGAELQCKIVGEGGNLGLTQSGRIEYGRNGGRINTDFIDNSAGVDCSDHEVNIKIAFSELLNSGSISMEERNSLLEKMEDEVSQLVLYDNHQQTQLITTEEERGSKQLDEHSWFIKHLENEGELDRKVEHLPSNDEITAILSEGGKLTRPSISVLTTYAKNSAANALGDSNFVQDKYFHKYLIDYFPKLMNQKYAKELLKHQLANEIIRTVTVNKFVNTMGCCFFHQLLDDLSYKPFDIIKAFIITYDAFEIQKLWDEVEMLGSDIPVGLQVGLFREIQEMIERNTVWILRHHNNIDNVEDVIKEYKQGIKELKNACDKETVIAAIVEEFEMHFTPEEKVSAIPKILLHKIFILKALGPAFDIIRSSHETKSDIFEVSKKYFHLGDKMSLNWMLAQAKRDDIVRQYVDTVALKAVVNEIYDIHMNLTIAELKSNFSKNEKEKESSDDMPDGLFCISGHNQFVKYNKFINEMKSVDSSNILATLTLAIKYLKELMKIHCLK